MQSAASQARGAENRLQLSSQRRLFIAVFLPLAVIYLLTATWQPPYDADTFTNAVTAYELGTHGDVFLERHEELTGDFYRGVVGWVVPARDSAASQYPPGAALIAAPLYAIWPADSETIARTLRDRNVEYELPPIPPAAIAASLAAAAGVAALALAMSEFLSRRNAALAAYGLGLATGVWSVAADKLWLHTGSVLYLGVALWLASAFYLTSGLGFGLAIMTRPHNLVIGLGTAIGRFLDTRSWQVLVRMLAGMGIGLVALVAFNYFVFDNPSITGGYRLRVGSFATRDNGNLITNVFGGFFDLSRGLFPLSPFLLALIPGVPAAWRASPSWVRGAAAGGLLYYAIQLYSNRFSGGSGFWGYRYPIEMLVAMTPLLALAYFEWVAPRPRAKRIFIVLLAVSVALHFAGALRCAQYRC
ncbi:MAG: hypothetical protein HKN91_10675 [Acidimicrobiia bacterium]|nr:hypothetical protein [Acidimicrobiia bacterium]